MLLAHLASAPPEEFTVADRRDEIADVLRGRILRGMHAGALRHGDRLQSARELEDELHIDHRVVLDAYRVLLAEGLVEMRSRGGIYVSARPGVGGSLALPQTWIVDILTQAVVREIPLPELHEWLRRLVETLRLRAVAIASTADQVVGICRELRDDYGLDASGVEIGALSEELPHEVRSADLIVTTEACAGAAQRVADQLGIRCIVIQVRLDLVAGDWRLLLREPVYVLIADASFADTLLRFFRQTPGAENIRPLVVGRDDLSAIPDNAPTYVTRVARDRLGSTHVRGRILPAPRLFSAESAREVIEFIQKYLWL